MKCQTRDLDKELTGSKYFTLFQRPITFLIINNAFATGLSPDESLG
jgi:hypothetical protein